MNKKLFCPHCKEELEHVWEVCKETSRYPRTVSEKSDEEWTYADTKDKHSPLDSEILWFECTECGHDEEDYNAFVIESEKLHVFIEVDSGMVNDVKVTKDPEQLKQFEAKWLADNGFKSYAEYHHASGGSCPKDIFFFEIEPEDFI